MSGMSCDSDIPPVRFRRPSAVCLKSPTTHALAYTTCGAGVAGALAGFAGPGLALRVAGGVPGSETDAVIEVVDMVGDGAVLGGGTTATTFEAAAILCRRLMRRVW